MPDKSNNVFAAPVPHSLNVQGCRKFLTAKLFAIQLFRLCIDSVYRLYYRFIQVTPSWISGHFVFEVTKSTVLQYAHLLEYGRTGAFVIA